MRLFYFPIISIIIRLQQDIEMCVNEVQIVMMLTKYVEE